ncbi:hypothetical protein [Rhizobium sp. NFR03]|uniref:hypothetical protein n=1 Tax=Rhizobium sp. NFR03 TaxID=1566263 RepID=UPI0008C289B5|nr:hypothetical protein [Rhizobium sp. NFR03]SES05637.1 hypothetical protein SAMN03159406_01963 [Rhizobium sp. NFR03]
MTDFIEVKPLKTFDNGSGLKTADSEPFKVERGEANALKAFGLVSFENDAASVEAPEEKPVPAPIQSDAGASQAAKTTKKKD